MQYVSYNSPDDDIIVNRAQFALRSVSRFAVREGNSNLNNSHLLPHDTLWDRVYVT